MSHHVPEFYDRVMERKHRKRSRWWMIIVGIIGFIKSFEYIILGLVTGKLTVSGILHGLIIGLPICFAAFLILWAFFYWRSNRKRTA